MIVLFLLNGWIGAGLYGMYQAIKKKQLLFDDHFTAALCMVVTMTGSFFFVFFLTLLFPEFMFSAILSGVIISWKFSSLLRNPAKLTGLYNGVMGGIMGAMLGAVVQNPALCNIPAESAASMQLLPFFAACLFTLMLLLVRYALRT